MAWAMIMVLSCGCFGGVGSAGTVVIIPLCVNCSCGCHLLGPFLLFVMREHFLVLACAVVVAFSGDSWSYWYPWWVCPRRQ